MTVRKGKEYETEERQQEYPSENGKHWPQILAVFTVSLGSFTTGLIFVWSSPFTLVLIQDKENYNITEDEASYLIIFQPIGMILMSFFIFKITEWLGRKKSVLLLAIPHVTYWIITMFAKSKWGFYMARFVGGLGDCCLFCGTPPYIGEITDPKVRGFWGNFPTFALYGGQLAITVMGTYLDIKTTAYIGVVFPVLFFLLVCLLPESPYQLIKDGKYDDARKAITWFRRKINIEQDFQNMKADVDRQMSESGTWKDLFTIDSNRRALRAGVFLRFSQQLCGVAVFSQYTQPIFEKAGGNISSQYSSMIFMGLIFALNLFCSGAVAKFGRKLSYFYSLLTSGFVLLIMGVYFLLDQYEYANLNSLGWFPLAGMLIWVFTYSFGLGVVPTLMLGELFSSSIKSKGLSILVTLFGLSVFLTSNIFNVLTAQVGLYSPFLMYGVCCLISTILTLRWVPETKGKTLEEIQQALKK